jgi:hypothetical protein
MFLGVVDTLQSVERAQQRVLIPAPQSPGFLEFGEAIRQEVIQKVAEGALHPISTSNGMRIWLGYDKCGRPKIGDAAHYAHSARAAASEGGRK